MLHNAHQSHDTHCSRGVFSPDETVEDKANSKNHCRVQSCCLEETKQNKEPETKHLTEALFQLQTNKLAAEL